MRGQRSRLVLLIAILGIVTVAAAGTVLAILYRSTLDLRRQALADLVTSREALIDAVFTETGDRDETIRMLMAAQREAPAIGVTGEFTVAERAERRVHFVVQRRYLGAPTVQVGSGLAEPMVRALDGGTGTLIGRDYRGRQVLAAYHRVDGLNWGLVAKIDLAEVREPFLHAAAVTFGVTLALVALGAVVFTRVTSPMIEALAKSETKFRALFDRSTVGKSLTAPDGRLLRVNQAFADLLGYSLEEMQGLDFARLTYPDDLPESRECIRRLLAGECESYRMEKRYVAKDGRLVWADVSTTLFRDEAGQPVYFITGIVDISDRKASQREVSESRQMLRIVLDTIPQRVFWKSTDLVYLGANRSFAADAGVAEVEDVIGRSDFDLPWTEHAEAYRSDDREVMDSKQSRIGFEEPLVLPDGSTRWLRTSKIPLLDDGGAVSGVLGVYEDITEQKAMKEALLAEKTFSDAMLTSLPGVAYLFDETLRFRRWNANFERVTGYSAAAFAELSPLELFGDPDRDRVAERIAEVFEAGESSVEADLVTATGGRVPFLFTGRRVEIGGSTFLVGMGVDISARKRAEKELAAANAELESRVGQRTRELEAAHARLRFVIGATPAVIYTREAAGGALAFVADTVAALLGHDPAAFTSSPDFWIDHVHPDDRQRVLAGLAEAAESGHVAQEYRFRHSRGHDLWLRDEARVVRDADGRRLEMVGAWIDVTERRENEERIATLNRELSATVEQLTAANRELESFSYTVSHDLRAPLRAIDGFSRLLVEEHADDLPAEATRYLSIVRDNTKAMGQLIDDLLAFSRLSRQEMHREAVHLDDVVDDAWRELAGEWEGRHIELVRDALPRVSGDPRLLKLVFANLLGNAVKFTRKREAARIEVGARREDGYHVCYIRDNGDGFDMRYKDKLFGVFQRLHRAGEFEGTGVGLATVARIVGRHGGRVWAEGEPGRGATFYVAFEGGDDDGSDAAG